MPLYDSTLLRIEMEGEAIRLWTYSRRHRSYGYHFLYRIDLETFLDGDTATLITSDNGSYLRCWKTNNDMLYIKLSWMNSTGRDDGSFTGWYDHIEVPLRAIYEMLSAVDCIRRFLHIHRRKPALFDFTNSQHVIASIIDNKRRKRAFSKGMRDYHAHHSGLFRMYSDYVKHSFYFETFEDGQERAYNGGFVLHVDRKNTPAGTREALVYRRHT